LIDAIAPLDPAIIRSRLVDLGQILGRPILA
jgi:hypothetical protein